ncbi:MAG: cysteine desulfurase family protein [Ilumatobacteraceae bacterium]
MSVYLDHAASTPMREVAIEAMRPYLDATYANPAGAHRFARRARKAVDEARDDIAQVIGCEPGEVIFTGGGTEADNATILGAVRKHGGVAVCSAAEHHAVLHCVEHTGGPIIGTTPTGAIDLEHLERVLRDQSIDVSVVSVMAVNNEVGTITPMRKVAALVREHRPNAILHCDAVQAACWLDLREISPLVDSIALSAHKFGGPKGVGVMTLRAGKSVEPLIFGGGQERDRRSGTHNVPGIVATAAALRATDEERASEIARLGGLSKRLEQGIVERVGEVTVTVPAEHRVPGVVHLCFSGVESEALLFLLDEANVYASAASACASGAMSPSHVLAAMGVSNSLIRGALRMSIGHTTTHDDIDRAIDAVSSAVLRLRAR